MVILVNWIFGNSVWIASFKLAYWYLMLWNVESKVFDIVSPGPQSRILQNKNFILDTSGNRFFDAIIHYLVKQNWNMFSQP